MRNLVKRMDLRKTGAVFAALRWATRTPRPHAETRAVSPARPALIVRTAMSALLALGGMGNTGKRPCR